MKSNFISTIFKILILTPLFFSCSSDLNFDQVKDLKLKPVFVANLAYFDIPANQLKNDGESEPFFDVSEFNAFKDQFFRDNLVKAEINFEVDNTIIRSFRLQVMLLDANDQILETDSYFVPAYSGTSNIIKYPTEVFENQRLDLLKKTAKLGFVVTMEPGPPLDENSKGSLKLRSGATVYMEIE